MNIADLIQFAIVAVLFLGIVYFALRRRRISRTENFERRDN